MTPFTVTIVRLSEIATDFVVGDITISDNASERSLVVAPAIG
ncbi:MAG: hypothetical protein ACNYPI_01365 [Arenicellales bacterium WSBS_2016_MAG_OTU3]